MDDGFEKIMVDAIRAKLAPDIHQALATARYYDMSSPNMPNIVLPLRADVRVVYDRNAAAISVKGRFLDSGSGQYHHVESFFSTLGIGSARDKAAMATFLFNHARDRFLRELADNEAHEMFGGRP